MPPTTAFPPARSATPGFKTGPADASPIVYTATRQFSGSRNQIRQASAEFALQGIVEHFLRHHAARPKGRGA